MTRRRAPAPAPPAIGPAPDAGYALACPGQGVDANDLAAVLTERGDDPLADRLATVLGTSDWATLDLRDTRVAQPSVYVASVLSATDPRHGDRAAAPAAVFGHSLGELAAATLAGVFRPAAGLDLVCRRAQLGHEAQQRRPGAMLVVMRLSEAEVEWLRRSVLATAGGVLELAVVNGTGQFVLSGDEATVDAATEVVFAAGGVARALPIGGAYHSPLLAGAVEPYAEALRAAATADPACPVVSCTTQQVLTTHDAVTEALARALVLPVRWEATLAAVHALGVARVVDVGPSQTLANLARFLPTLPFESLRPDPRRDT